MTDPLGQSQVIPYLSGLSEKGYNITLLSAEKQENYITHKSKITELLNKNNINWEPVFYTKNPPILSTLKDVFTLKNKATQLQNLHSFNIVHCRSYIAAFVGVYLKRKFGCKFVFDMRGFWPDERVDGNIWNLKNPVYKWVYSFFKRKEKQFLNFSDAIISLTHAGKDEILKWKLGDVNSEKISIIPCCADFNHFNFSNVNEETKKQWKTKLGIPENRFILNYLGSIGTWYLLEEMLLFFKILQKKVPEAMFLFITHDKTNILETAKRLNIDTGNIKITSASRDEVPELISISNASIFFIKPVWSKKASSPTKMAELMGMGIPIIANNNVGDVDQILDENPTGITIKEFNNLAFEKAIDELLAIANKKESEVRELACNYFSLEKGISIFNEIYKKLS